MVTKLSLLEIYRLRFIKCFITSQKFTLAANYGQFLQAKTALGFPAGIYLLKVNNRNNG